MFLDDIGVVHRVYWTEEGSPKSKSFGKDEIDAALKHCEKLRQDRLTGKSICFITLASENPDATHLDGAAAPSPKYDWQKRRGGRK
jgi:hypothetical protein